MITWFIIAWVHNKRPSIVEAMTGAVAGLATITPAAGYVAPWAAAIFGIAAGVICYLAVVIRKKLCVDDALDVWGAHGVGGVVGSLLLGVFAQAAFGGVNGIIGGNPGQLFTQFLAVAIVACYSLVMTYVLLAVINVFSPIRVSKEVELKGLDVTHFNEEAYGEI